MILIVGIDFKLYDETFNNLCEKLSIKINIRKNKAHIINDFLGIEIDTILMKARLPPDKLKMTIELMNETLKKKFISMKNLQSLMNFFVFAAKVVILGRIFFRRFYNVLSAKYAKIRMTAAMKEDLRWWKDFLLKWNEIRLLRKDRPIIRIWIDASGNYGMGEYMLHEDENINCMPVTQIFFKRFFIKQKFKHINFKEMKAILHALNLFGPNAADCCIHFHCDNFVVAKKLKKFFMKGDAMKPLRAIVMKMILFDIVIKFIWIFIKKNFLTNVLFRGRFDKVINYYSHLQIPREIFQFRGIMRFFSIKKQSDFYGGG